MSRIGIKIAIALFAIAAVADEVFDADLCKTVPSALGCWSNGAHSLSVAAVADSDGGTRRVFRVETGGTATALTIARECPLDSTIFEFTYFLPSNAPVRSISAGMRVKEDGGNRTEVRFPPVFGQWRTERIPIARLMRGDTWRAGTASTAQSLEIGIISHKREKPLLIDFAHIRILHEEGPCSPLVRPMRLVGSGTFARRFEVVGTPRKAWLMALGRPRFRAAVNGRDVGGGTFTNAEGWPCLGGKNPVAAEFSLDGILRNGENVVEFTVDSGEGAECVAAIGWENVDDHHYVVATDASWLCDGTPPEALPLADTAKPSFWDIYPVRPPAAWRPVAERTNPASAPEVTTRSPLLHPSIAPGRWGTERRADGRWFLTTPAGNPFFLYGIQTVNCFRQNYGYLDWARRAYPDEAAWASDAVAFVQRLGFNAVGVAASSRSAFDAAGERGMLNLEYVGCADGGPFLVNAQGKRLFGLCDPFDPEFRRRLRERLASAAPDLNARPAVFGICVGNEAHIEGNVASVSSSGYVYSEACGREFVRWLRERYNGDVALLNRAWFGSRESEWFRDFEEVLERKPDPFNGHAPVIDDPEYVAAMAHLGRPVATADGAAKGAMRTDFDEFAVHTVRAYADTVLSLMREFFPDKLIGTNRFLGGATEAMYRCWSGYDFIAVNSYPMATWGEAVFTKRQMDLLRLAHRATGRPVLLTEWGVQAMDVCLQSPSAQLWTQAERGRGYGKALRQIVEELPFVAGVVAFGFQNLADSEGQGWGLMDNEGRPYRDYVEGVADATRWLDRFLDRIPSAASVTTPAPGWMFTEDEAPVFVLRPSSSVVDDGGTDSTFIVRDWRGNEVRRGQWPEDGRLELAPLPPGFYRVETGSPLVTRHSSLVTSFDFCVVRRDPCRNPDSPFAVDSALSHRAETFDCPWYGGNTFRVVCELMRKCGIVQTRERMVWKHMNPEPGVYTYGRRLDNVAHLRANGLVTTGIFAGTPVHAGGEVIGSRHLPTDLMALYTLMTNAVPTFGEAYNAWGFWNEPDLAMVPEPVWEYIAAFKAFALAVRAADPAKPVLLGALADVPDTNYGNGLATNEFAKYADIFNIHTYLEPARLSGWHAVLHAYLKQCGRPGWAVWLTEFGTNLEGDSVEDGVRAGLKAHTPEQEMVWAEWCPKGAILQQMGGIDRSWLFLFGCYNERGGRKDWGTMRRDGHVKPICAALSALTGELGNAHLLGEVKVGDGIRAFLYDSLVTRHSSLVTRSPSLVTSQTLVFWSVSEVDTAMSGPVHPKEPLKRPISIAVPRSAAGASGETAALAAPLRLIDMMGTPRPVPAITNNTLALVAERYPQYLTGPLGLTPDIPAPPRGRTIRYEAAPGEDLTVVVRPKLSADFEIAGHKSRAELTAKGSGALTVELWNFSGEEKRGRLAASPDDTLSGASDEIVLPPWGHVALPVRYAPPTNGPLDTVLSLRFSSPAGLSTATRIPVFDRARFLDACEMVPLALEDPALWIRNDSGQTFSCTYDEAEKAIRWEVGWTGETGPWFMPRHELKLPEESFAGAKMLEFEVKSDQDKVENDYNSAVLMPTWADGHSENLHYPPPGHNWEVRRVALPSDAEGVVSIRLGGAPRGRRLTFWLRNVRLLKEPR